MGVLVAVLVYIFNALLDRGIDGNHERPLSVLRERYARGELSEDGVERRREQLDRTS